jgi:hypothetical protein
MLKHLVALIWAVMTDERQMCLPVFGNIRPPGS